jgi:hypothetical protein
MLSSLPAVIAAAPLSAPFLAYSSHTLREFDPFPIDLFNRTSLLFWGPSNPDVNVSLSKNETTEAFSLSANQNSVILTDTNASLSMSKAATLHQFTCPVDRCRSATLLFTTPRYLTSSLVLVRDVPSLCLFPFVGATADFELEITNSTSATVNASHFQCQSRRFCSVHSAGGFFVELFDLSEGDSIRLTIAAVGAKDSALPCQGGLVPRVAHGGEEEDPPEELFEREALVCEAAEAVIGALKWFGLIFLRLFLLIVSVSLVIRFRHSVCRPGVWGQGLGRKPSAPGPDSLLTNVAEPIDPLPDDAERGLSIL